MRRAALSIMSNIAEGFSRFHRKEFINFLNIAQSSTAELKSQLYIALNLIYISQNEFSSAVTLTPETRKTLLGLVRYLKSTQSKSKFKEPIHNDLSDTQTFQPVSLPEHYIDREDNQ